MKKFITTLVVALCAVSALVAGTMAVYTTGDKQVTGGSVVAKEFKVTTECTLGESFSLTIAPEESIEIPFSVSNFDGAIKSGVDMELAIAAEVKAADGKTAIAPLKATLTKTGGAVSGDSLTAGVGVLNLSDVILISESTKNYVLNIIWESTANDIDFAGSAFGSSVTIKIVATQKTI